MNKLVIGADGSLGSLIYQRAADVFGAQSVIAGYYQSDERIKAVSPDAITRQLDARDTASLEQAMQGVDCVLAAVPQHEPLIQQVAARLGVHSVDVSADYGVARQAVQTIDSPDSVQLVCAGQAPGVTGLMARELHQQTGQPVTVGFLLADGGRSGRVGVADMLGQMNQSPHQPERFTYHGVGTRYATPIEHSEMDVAGSGSDIVPMRAVVAFENKFQNSAIRLLKRLGLLGVLYGNQQLLGLLAKSDKSTDDEVIYLGATSADRRLDVRSQSDYMVAAYSAAAFAQLALEQQLRGVGIPAQYVTLDDVIDRLDGALTRVD